LLSSNQIEKEKSDTTSKMDISPVKVNGHAKYSSNKCVEMVSAAIKKGWY
jgi:hypothetical protein